MDATFGRGGHAGAILENLIADGRLLCLDRDPAAIAEARIRFESDPRVAFFLAPFSSLADCADQVEPDLKFDGILFDLGVSSPQLDDPARGFSFMQDGPLDMRMTPGVGTSAADVVNGASLDELIRIFREYGEEREAPRIARAIVKDRESRPFETTLQLAEMIARVARSRERHKHPATRVFQALRIHVNRELAELEAGLEAALSRLAFNGRLAVISFHSLEDRMVKQFMRRHSLADPDVCRAARHTGARPAEAEARRQGDAAGRERIRRESARAQRAAARRRTPEPRNSRMKNRRWLALAMPVLWLAVLGSAVQVIYARHKARDLFVRLEKLNAERDSLDMEWGRLQLEQSYWSSNAFVERVANAKLRMNLPQTRDVRIVRP